MWTGAGNGSVEVHILITKSFRFLFFFWLFSRLLPNWHKELFI